MMGVGRLSVGNQWRRGALVWAAAVYIVVAAGLQPRVCADQAVVVDERYGELARQLEPWVAAEVAGKGLPALSIALVDDQRIVWARGFGFADAARTVDRKSVV